MTRIEKTSANATQSKYMTFRVVSDQSPVNSWMHPGYKAHNVVAAVESFCRPAVESMIKSAAERDLEIFISKL